MSPTIEEMAALEGQPVEQAPVSPAPPEEKRVIEMPAFLRAKTGTGDIKSYLEHPLNFDKSEGLAQVIRGFTGMFDALDLAVIDIAVGFFRWRKGAGVGV